jgi:hypothetical protein
VALVRCRLSILYRQVGRARNSIRRADARATDRSGEGQSPKGERGAPAERGGGETSGVLD